MTEIAQKKEAPKPSEPDVRPGKALSVGAGFELGEVTVITQDYTHPEALENE
jgi:hypothetical protein